ncbi:MAG TPA: GatB/YqeY domain-containing protein [Candidatus Methylomirabilis sp.]|nr:GatB/YqeY domain-containing protein [Candidatus Methylomirabilis sp.]
MDFTDRLHRELQAALKAGRKVEASTLRLLLTAVKNREVEKRGQLSEPEILQVIVKESNQRREAIQQFRQGGREDLARKEEAELQILEKFLPQAISPEELSAKVREAIAATGAKSVKDMGKVMSHLMAQLAGRADGKVVSQLVRQELSGEG